MANEQENVNENQKDNESNDRKEESDNDMEEEEVPDIYTFLDIPRDASQQVSFA